MGIWAPDVHRISVPSALMNLAVAFTGLGVVLLTAAYMAPAPPVVSPTILTPCIIFLKKKYKDIRQMLTYSEPYSGTPDVPVRWLDPRARRTRPRGQLISAISHCVGTTGLMTCASFFCSFVGQDSILIGGIRLIPSAVHP
jgi:hypothetical protein